MSKICEITGKSYMTGNKVSHSHHKTKRVFKPNFQTKTFYIPEEDRSITIRVSTEGIRNINKKGIAVCVKEAREKGFLAKK